MIEIIKKYWYIPVIALVIGFFIGRVSIEKNTHSEQLQSALVVRANELNSKYAKQLIDSSKVIGDLNKKLSDAIRPIIVRHEAQADSSVQVVLNDTNTTDKCKDAIGRQCIVISDLKTKAIYDSLQLKECDNQNSLKDGLIVKKDKTISEQQEIYNSLLDKTKVRLFTPFIDVSYNSFGYIGAGVGVYYKNIGAGARYITDFNKKGLEITGHIKF